MDFSFKCPTSFYNQPKILELLKRELIKHKNDYEKFMKKVNDHGLKKEVNMWQIIEGEYKEISEATGKEFPELIGEEKYF